jgi:hypothetical protein
VAAGTAQGAAVRAAPREITYVPLLSDNQACIRIAQDPTSHNRTKHIDVRYHYIRQLATYGKVSIDYVSTESMLADILTKPLAATAFKRCIQGLIAECS